MTETTRTTVTLSLVSMKQVEELVGVFGNSPASVISRIVEHFFDYGRFDDVLTKLRAKKKSLYPPEETIIKEKILNLLKGADKIPLDSFCEYLEVERNYALSHISEWSKKYNIKMIKNLIIKD